MDEIFWSNVVKRWSEASENVIKLKNELAKVREERSFYRNTILDNDKGGNNKSSRSKSTDNLRSAPNTSLDASLPYHHDEPIHGDELKDAEIGFGKAKEEYRKLQQELSVSTETIAALKRENERLKDLQEEVARLRRDDEVIQRLQQELDVLQSNNEALNEKIRLYEQQQRQPSSRWASTSTAPVHHSVDLITLQRDVKKLQEALENREADNEVLRDELDIMREKLYKAGEDKKTLLSSIVKLQTIARQSVHSALHPLSSNLLQVRSGRSSRASGAISVTSSRRSQAGDTQFLKPPEDTLHSKSSHSRLVEDITVVEDHTSPPVPISPPGILDTRKKILTSFPPVALPNQHDLTGNSFSREFLKETLGGDTQPLLDRLSAQAKTSQKKPSLCSYLCPTLNHHPWCPSIPGQHGFIFVGLGKEKDSYRTPVVRNLFVGLQRPAKGHRSFRYLGSYKVVRIQYLSLEEWCMLPLDIKTMYAKHTKEKTNDPRSYEEIFLDYDSGDLNVPCVQVQCLYFDHEFYSALIAQRNSQRL